ncbi:hypothetical protein DXA13_06175 [Clostridium sp. AM58-1XD]|nr:hypothetical protein DXA13_06175 [Clostridium sp. AM58-1XD]
MSDIKYASVNKQIEKLKSHNLIINNEPFAKQCLEIYGYSNLIKSYRDPYVIISDNGIKNSYRILHLNKYFHYIF